MALRTCFLIVFFRKNNLDKCLELTFLVKQESAAADYRSGGFIMTWCDGTVSNNWLTDWITVSAVVERELATMSFENLSESLASPMWGQKRKRKISTMIAFATCKFADEKQEAVSLKSEYWMFWSAEVADCQETKKSKCFTKKFRPIFNWPWWKPREISRRQPNQYSIKYY